MLLILALVLAAVTVGWLHVDAALPVAAVFAWISIWSVVTTLKAGIPIPRFPASWLGGSTALLTLIGWI